MTVTLSALVIRTPRREPATRAAARLWASVEQHEHVGRRTGTIVRCTLCGAVLMGATS